MGARPQSWPGPAWCLKESQVGFSSGVPGYDMTQLVFQKAHTSLCGRRPCGLVCTAVQELSSFSFPPSTIPWSLVPTTFPAIHPWLSESDRPGSNPISAPDLLCGYAMGTSLRLSEPVSPSLTLGVTKVLQHLGESSADSCCYCPTPPAGGLSLPLLDAQLSWPPGLASCPGT